MAINHWTKQTSYNPLPTGWGDYVYLELKEYEISFKAKSDSSGVIQIVDASPHDVLHDFQLTNTLTECRFTFTSTAGNQKFYIYDKNSTGDIIIEDIRLVEKGHGNATLNAIDGFESGKWSLHANASIVDDETLVLNATGANQLSTLIVPIDKSLVGKNMSLLGTYDVPSSYYWIDFHNSQGAYITGFSVNQSPFVVPVGATSAKIVLSNSTSGTFTFKRPMLTLGSQPIPYQRKTGDRLVKPNLWEDGTYRVNAQAKGLVPKKNLVPTSPSAWEKGSVTANIGQLLEDNDTGGYDRTRIRSAHLLGLTSGYTVSFNDTEYQIYIAEVNASGMVTGSTGGWASSSPLTRTPTSNTTSIKVVFRRKDAEEILTSEIEQVKPMLVEGTTAQPYEPYALTNPRNKRSEGIKFLGNSYVQLPSMTMDSIEIDCEIDVVQGNGSYYLLDARSGFTNGYVYSNSNDTGGVIVYENENLVPNNRVTNMTKGERITVKTVFSSSITDNLNIFSRYEGTERLKGTLYAIRCYLNGAIVAEYDTNTIGDKLLTTNVKQLIPSFDDDAWNIHANARVLGKDVLELVASGSYQLSEVWIEVKPNSTYFFDNTFIGFDNRMAIAEYEEDKTTVTYSTICNNTTPSKTITVKPTGKWFRIRLENGTNGPGTFQFVQPTLYEVTNAGTIVGGASSERKKAKRVLYAKR